MAAPRLLFVTGRFAESALRKVLPPLALECGFEYQIVVLPITVAALMSATWVARKLPSPEGFDRVLVPGYCSGDLALLESQWKIPVERGPKDLFDLPDHFGKRRRADLVLDEHGIEILAEINHAPRLSLDDLERAAAAYRDSGADRIDLGCIPGEIWTDVGAATRRLVSAGFRVSIDSFQREEVEAAVDAGADLVLSCNRSNLTWAVQVPAEFVAVPDAPTDGESLVETARSMTSAGRSVRWDPILEPIGFGFATSLARYFAVRQRQPDAEMMMGTGNLTELTEVDSAGVNFLLAAICEELRIGSILTTEVINWCRTTVREFDLARRLVRYSQRERRLPKHLDGRLLLLRDARLKELGEQGLEELRRQITDPNFRVFAERGEIHVLNRDGYWHGSDPYDVFDRMLADVGSLTSEHSFYLGMELMKARTALTLGKCYTQDESLRWGFLTVDEISAVERRRSHRRAETEDTRTSFEEQGAACRDSEPA